MGMVVRLDPTLDSRFFGHGPRASKVSHKDTAHRFRAIPVSALLPGNNSDVVLIPKEMLNEAGGVDAVSSLLQRVNALEVALAIRNGYASPLTALSPVTPIRPVIATLEQQSVAVPVAPYKPSGIFVSGNEAEKLDVDEATVPVRSRKEEKKHRKMLDFVKDVSLHNVPSTPKEMPVVGDVTKVAANEAALAEWETVVAPAASAKETEFKALARGYNWDFMEVATILGREYYRRNEHARKRHGMSYDEIRMKRWYAQEGVGQYHPSAASGLAKWAAEVEVLHYSPDYRSRVRRLMLKYDRLAQPYAMTMEKLIRKGLPIAKARMEAARKDELKARSAAVAFAGAVRFAEFNTFAKGIAPKVSRTSAAQLSLMKTWWDSVRNRVRGVFGKAPRMYNTEAALKKGLLVDHFTPVAFRVQFDTPMTPIIGPQEKELAAATEHISNAEMVRRYHRATIRAFHDA